MWTGGLRWEWRLLSHKGSSDKGTQVPSAPGPWNLNPRRKESHRESGTKSPRSSTDPRKGSDTNPLNPIPYTYVHTHEHTRKYTHT